eukprot:9827599-Lingulodinium_polyedra.AAC.1
MDSVGPSGGPSIYAPAGYRPALDVLFATVREAQWAVAASGHVGAGFQHGATADVARRLVARANPRGNY